MELHTYKLVLHKDLKVEYLSHIGSRSYMEDTFAVKEYKDGVLFIICDGHGGIACAQFVTSQLPCQFEKYYTRQTRPLTALKKAMKKTCVLWDKKCFGKYLPKNEQQKQKFFDSLDDSKYEEDGHDSGTTVLITYIQPQKRKVSIVTLGDSRCRWKIGNIIGETCDQKPAGEGAGKRSGYPYWIDKSDGIPRINGILAVGSALGDNTRELWGVVGRIPNTYSLSYANKALSMVMATDGLWDELTQQNVFDMGTVDVTEDNVTIFNISQLR